jgi:peroxiredoxin Q/BCP
MPRAKTISAGRVAPDFELATDNGSALRLSSLRGQRVVLFFYPRADTPGCTVEACEFRDSRPVFDDLGVVVLGLSPDPEKDITRFREKFGLNFRLLADADHSVAKAYGVWRRKQLFGHRFMGVERTTFLIDEEGRISRVWEKVKPQGHALEVAQALGSQ